MLTTFGYIYRGGSLWGMDREFKELKLKLQIVAIKTTQLKHTTENWIYCRPVYVIINAPRNPAEIKKNARRKSFINFLWGLMRQCMVLLNHLSSLEILCWHWMKHTTFSPLMKNQIWLDEWIKGGMIMWILLFSPHLNCETNRKTEETLFAARFADNRVILLKTVSIKLDIWHCELKRVMASLVQTSLIRHQVRMGLDMVFWWHLRILQKLVWITLFMAMILRLVLDSFRQGHLNLTVADRVGFMG